MGAGLCDDQGERAYTAYDHIMIVNRLEANKERFRPEGFDKIRPHYIRSLQFDRKVRLLSFRPEKFDLLRATPSKGQGHFVPAIWATKIQPVSATKMSPKCPVDEISPKWV